MSLEGFLKDSIRGRAFKEYERDLSGFFKVYMGSIRVVLESRVPLGVLLIRVPYYTGDLKKETPV